MICSMATWIGRRSREALREIGFSGWATAEGERWDP